LREPTSILVQLNARRFLRTHLNIHCCSRAGHVSRDALIRIFVPVVISLRVQSPPSANGMRKAFHLTLLPKNFASKCGHSSRSEEVQ
jgi:hypothetical protein